MAMMTDAARRKQIEEALDALPQETERIPLPWRNGTSIFPVIQLRLDSVLLNPRSHRIRSQLESHPKKAVVEQAPYSEESQEVVAQLLRETDGYDALKANLSQEKQREAGIITRAGVLINANTRAVALRDIEKEENCKGYIRVAVLPKDATESELDELELRLQMKKDYKQEYSFTNELLFVDELLTKYSYSPVDAASHWDWQPLVTPRS